MDVHTENLVRGSILAGVKYVDIQRKYGVSSKTIARVVKEMRAGGTLPEKVSVKVTEKVVESVPVVQPVKWTAGQSWKVIVHWDLVPDWVLMRLRKMGAIEIL